MERNRLGSVDDLVGGLLGRSLNGLNGLGMARIDSESEFTEFLKRIPSSNNLAAVNALDPAAQLQYQTALQAATPGGVPAAPIIDVNAVSAAGVGLPRVPSLDFLRQLASAQQLASVGGIKMESPSPVPPTTGPLPLPALSAVDIANLNASAALSTALQTVPLTTLAPHLALPNPAMAAAAALQMNPLPPATRSHAGTGAASGPAQQSNGGQAHSEATSPSSNERDMDKSDSRKARRMLSNRESARRSRRRKQEHLSKLEQEISVMQEEKRQWTDQLTSLERRCATVNDENRRLKEENERLRDELQFLRSELKERNVIARREQEDDDEERQQEAAAGLKRLKPDPEGPASSKETETGT